MPSRYPRYYDSDRKYGEDDRYARRGSQYDMSVVRRSRTQDFDGYGSDVDYRRRTTRGQDQYGNEPVYNLNPRRDRSAGTQDGYSDSRLSRSRRESAPDDWAYGYADGRGPRRARSERRRDSSDRQTQSRGPYQPRAQQGQQQRYQSQADGTGGTPEGDFMRRNFDRGPDGLITGAAGAALGAITARHFGGPKEFSPASESKQGRIRKNWKSIVGAAVGAVAANAAEMKLKSYFEERDADERKEHIETGGEFAGEMMAAVGPDVLKEV